MARSIWRLYEDMVAKIRKGGQGGPGGGFPLLLPCFSMFFLYLLLLCQILVPLPLFFLSSHVFLLFMLNQLGFKLGRQLI